MCPATFPVFSALLLYPQSITAIGVGMQKNKIAVKSYTFSERFQCDTPGCYGDWIRAELTGVGQADYDTTAITDDIATGARTLNASSRLMSSKLAISIDVNWYDNPPLN